MSTPTAPTEYKSLYEMTGRITDVNTVLINRKDLEPLLKLLEAQTDKDTE